MFSKVNIQRQTSYFWRTSWKGWFCLSTKLSPLRCTKSWMVVFLKLWRNSEFVKKTDIIRTSKFSLIVNSVYNGTETGSFLGSKICEWIPTEIKELVSLNGFKKAIKKWKPVNYPSRLCKSYIHVGFISYLNT